MWQTKYAAAIPKNLGLGLKFRPCSEGFFLSGRPQSVCIKMAHICHLSILHLRLLTNILITDLKHNKWAFTAVSTPIKSEQRKISWEIHRKLFCQASLNRWSFQQHKCCKTPVYPWMNFGLSNDTKGSTAQPCYLQLSYWYIVCSLQTSFIIFLVIQRGEKYLQNRLYVHTNGLPSII